MKKRGKEGGEDKKTGRERGAEWRDGEEMKQGL